MYAALFQREALLQALRERGVDLNAAGPAGQQRGKPGARRDPLPLIPQQLL